MDAKTFNGFLFLLIVFLALLFFSGKLHFQDLWPLSISKSALRWRLAWATLGSAVAFILVWGKKIAPDKAFWAAVVCLLLAFLLF